MEEILDVYVEKNYFSSPCGLFWDNCHDMRYGQMVPREKEWTKKEKIGFTEPAFAYFVLCSQLVLGVLQAHSHLFSVTALHYKVSVVIPFNRQGRRYREANTLPMST